MLIRSLAFCILLMSPFRVAHSGCISMQEPNEQVYGVDVSHHQKEIDWDVVAINDEIDFAFVKATEGSDYTDSLFCRNWEDLGRTTIRRGAYHFFRAYGCGDTQARHFLSTVEMRPGDLPPVLDVETLDGQLPSVLHQEMHIWLQTVENRLGVRPIIYSSQDFYQRFLASEFSNSRYPLWIARYSDQPPALNGFTPWSIWQNSNEGCVEGISKKVDTNIFPGTIEDLDQLAWDPLETTLALP
jgi:lysozyme